MTTFIKDLGIHEVIEYRNNDKGEKVKIIKTVKRYSVPVKKYESVTNRQNTWTKFGKATSEGNDKVTFRSTEDVFMEPPSPKGGSKTKKNESAMMKCRHCDSNHWTRLCPTLEENKEKKLDVSETKETKGKDSSGKPYYEKKIYNESSKTTKTIMIQNLSKDIQEFDIHELLSSTGCHIYKIFIPKDYQTGDSRGMAFVDVKNIEEANSIIIKYNNMGLNYLRIKISLI